MRTLRLSRAFCKISGGKTVNVLKINLMQDEILL